jgi:hypothetical protein
MQWLWFALGQMLNILRQANLVAASSSNPVSKMREWVWRNLVGLLIRSAFALSTWYILTETNLGPVAITKLAGAEWVPNIPLSQMPLLALPFGIVFDLLFDMAIERWPWLKSKLPVLQ